MADFPLHAERHSDEPPIYLLYCEPNTPGPAQQTGFLQACEGLRIEPSLFGAACASTILGISSNSSRLLLW